MDSATLSRAIERVRATRTATIAASGTTSTAFKMAGAATGKLYLPTGFEGTAVTFLECDTVDGTFVTVADGDGNDVSKTVAAGKSIPLPTELCGSPYVKVVSGSTETAERTLTIPIIG